MVIYSSYDCRLDGLFSAIGSIGGAEEIECDLQLFPHVDTRSSGNTSGMDHVSLQLNIDILRLVRRKGTVLCQLVLSLSTWYGLFLGTDIVIMHHPQRKVRAGPVKPKLLLRTTSNAVDHSRLLKTVIIHPT